MKVENEKFKIAMFTIYTILYECLVWGLTASAIYYLHFSSWLILVGIIMSGAQLKPWHFGLNYKDPNPLPRLDSRVVSDD